jgi:signal transduction histidine kinase
LIDALHPTFLKFQLLENGMDTEHFDIPKSFDSKIVTIDNIDQQHDAALYKALSEQNISIVSRLRTPKKDIGFIIVGYRLSGSTYNDIDLRLIGIAADEIAISLQNAFRFIEIENFNKTLQDKIDDATHKLRRANEKLKILDETKDDFISMASHQLRTPLTSVKGYISMMLEGDAGKLNVQQKEMLNQTFLSSQRMVYLIADMLNVSRLKTGKFAIDNTPVNLGDIIEQEMEQLKETASAHSVKLIYNKPKDFPVLMLDETKIRQVIMNFSDNAIYYTPPNGEINVILEDKGSNIELRIHDSGIGVPKNEQPHLFTKFYRAVNARKARPDGTGLGLFMAKKVIVAQGGSLIFESEEGKGSTFGFSFSKSKLLKTTADDPKS